MYKKLLLITSCTVLLIAGCGTNTTTTSTNSNQTATVASSTPTTSTSTTPDACALMTHDQIEAAVGHTFKPAPTASGTQDNESTCTWEEVSIGGEAVNFTIHFGDNEVSLFKNAKDHPILRTPTIDIPNLGDSAFFDPSISVVNILKGSRSLTIQYIASPSTEKDMEIKLANLVVSKF